MSWAAEKLACDKYGPENVTLLFADTGIEDEDLYRFLHRGADALRATLIKIRSDKFKNPFEVAEHYKIFPGNNMPACSSFLKRDDLDKWQRENCDKDTIFVFGFSQDEEKRIQSARKRNPKKNLWFPLAERAYSHCEIMGWLDYYGISLPRLYRMGFMHNNCGGFCFQGGHGHFAKLLQEIPARFWNIAKWEKNFRERHSQERTILRKMINGEQVPYTLYDLAADYHSGNIKLKELRDIYVNCACSEMWAQGEFELQTDILTK